MSEHENAAQTAERLVKFAALKIQTTDQLPSGRAPFMATPADVKINDLSKYLPEPLRIEAAPSFNDAASFGKYYEKFADTDSILFADLSSRKIKSIFDYHGPSDPDWCKHSASFNCELSDEWKIWLESNKRKMDQADFANFIENNLPDIIEPKAADMLEMIIDVSANTNVTFKSKYSLVDGRISMQYSEDRADSGNREMELPATFVINIPVFINTDATELEVKIRNRIRDGKLVLWYELQQPHKEIDLAFRAIVETIKEITDAEILFGTA